MRHRTIAGGERSIQSFLYSPILIFNFLFPYKLHNESFFYMNRKKKKKRRIQIIKKKKRKLMNENKKKSLLLSLKHFTII